MFSHLINDILDVFGSFRSCGKDGSNFTSANKSYKCGACLILKEKKELEKMLNYSYDVSNDDIYLQFIKFINSFKECLKWLEKNKKEIYERLEYLRG